ncbi:hypothetical protein OXX80_006879 [Metschnikowia pulcherrima]
MSFLDEYFSVQVFFIVLRETIESAIIVSVLLAFVNKSLEPVTHEQKNSATEINSDQIEEQNAARGIELHKLKFQIWAGGICGFLACLVVGAVILTVFYVIGNDLWSKTEHYWEGGFSVLASVIISVMGVKILRVTRLQEKWKKKLGHVMKSYNLKDATAKAAWTERNAMFILPFVTTLREGLEAIVFVGGIGINENTSVWSIINAAIVAMAIGSAVGIALYRSGNTLSLQVFLIVSTCFLYLVAAGLFSKGIWNFELQRFIDMCGGMDVSETGHGPGSYDISTSVWHVNCCNGEMAEDGVFWMLFTAVFGWTNSATYGSVFGYILYWFAVVLVFNSLRYEERYGRLPIVPLSWQKRRIQKRQYLALLPDGSTEPRESVDSINSMTPLRQSQC